MAETKATILGAGAIGMAMAVVLSDTGHKVVFWDIEPTVLDGINKKHLNPRSLSHIKLEKNVSAEADLQKAVFGAEIVVVALSSRAVREVFDFRPAAMIQQLDLRRPVFQATAAYGHFGRSEPEFSWEKTDKAKELRRYLSS